MFVFFASSTVIGNTILGARVVDFAHDTIIIMCSPAPGAPTCGFSSSQLCYSQDLPSAAQQVMNQNHSRSRRHRLEAPASGGQRARTSFQPSPNGYELAESYGWRTCWFLAVLSVDLCGSAHKYWNTNHSKKHETLTRKPYSERVHAQRLLPDLMAG